jgi:hypothetical protein
MGALGGKDDRRIRDLQRILFDLVVIVIFLLGFVDVFHFFVSVVFTVIVFIIHRVLKDEFVVKQCKEATRMKWSPAHIDEVSDVIPARLSEKRLFFATRSELTLQSLAWASPSSCH